MDYWRDKIISYINGPYGDINCHRLIYCSTKPWVMVVMDMVLLPRIQYIHDVSLAVCHRAPFPQIYTCFWWNTWGLYTWYSAEGRHQGQQGISDGCLEEDKAHQSNLHPHPLYVVFHYSHPPVMQRIRIMAGLLPRKRCALWSFWRGELFSSYLRRGPNQK